MSADRTVFLEIIEYPGEISNEIAHRIPPKGSAEFKFGGQLIVRDYQTAVFYNGGRATDVFGPGRHTLSTWNLPILTKLLSLPWGFKSPIRTEVYFIQNKIFKDLKWGTKEPVAFRDTELGLVRLRAFGNYTFQIKEPQLFINTCAAGDDSFTTDEIEDFLRDVIVSRLNDLLGENLKSVFDLAGNYDELSAGMQQRLEEDFATYGIEIGDFYVQAITPPPEVQKAIDERSSMGALGDLNKYMKFKAAKALGDAANNPGGAAAAGVGIGAGMGMGAMLPGMIYESMQAPQQQSAGGGGPAPQALGTGIACTKCHNEIAADARFCHHCGAQVVVQQRCPDCGQELPVEAKFCFSCGSTLARKSGCIECGEELPKGSKFCFHCGAKQA